MRCRYCDSDAVIHFGSTSSGNPRQRCTTCKRTFCQQPDARKHSDDLKEQVLRAYHERASMRGVCRIFGINRNTLMAWLGEKNRRSSPV